jgi:hypothetical protein
VHQQFKEVVPRQQMVREFKRYLINPKEKNIKQCKKSFYYSVVSMHRCPFGGSIATNLASTGFHPSQEDEILKKSFAWI